MLGAIAKSAEVFVAEVWRRRAEIEDVAGGFERVAMVAPPVLLNAVTANERGHMSWAGATGQVMS
jgi:hypothetical protein